MIYKYFNFVKNGYRYIMPRELSAYINDYIRQINVDTKRRYNTA
jgi:hypothetical protein